MAAEHTPAGTLRPRRAEARLGRKLTKNEEYSANGSFSSPPITQCFSSPEASVRAHPPARLRRVGGLERINGQAARLISIGKLHVLPHFHTRPIDVVVYHEPSDDFTPWDILS